MPLVEIRDIHKRFDAQDVLKGVSLNVDSGEVVCLLGASGSGKTTLLRCINHLETIDDGEIRVAGDLVGYALGKNGKLREEKDKITSAKRARIGMVFQRFNLFAHLTVLENVTEAPVQVLRQPRDAARAKALEEAPELEVAHEATARDGDAKSQPANKYNDALHFICLVAVDGGLYELDGRKQRPILHGRTSKATLLADAVPVVKQFMERAQGDERFCIIALAPPSLLGD